MFYTYMIFNQVNGKIYIGQTNDIKRRWLEHLRDANASNRPKYPINKAIKKYGENNFIFTKLNSFTIRENALAAEIYWIEYFKSNILKYGKNFGYNCSEGGTGSFGGPMKQSHRDNISKAKMGIKRSLISNIKESKSKSTFTINELEEIKQLLINNISQYKIAEQFNCSQGIISDMKIGKSHRYFFTTEDIETFNKIERPTFGTNNPASKLNDSNVNEIKHLLSKNIPIKEIAALFSVGKTTIHRIKNKTHWKHLL